jgi:cell division protein FtsN
MLFGLSIGLTVALVVYLKTGAPGTVPESTPRAAATAPRAEDRPSTSPSIAAAQTVTLSAAPQALPAETTSATTAADDEAALGFYDELSELEVNLPVSDRPIERAPRAYTLQAGAFRTHDEADRRQARIALLGIESNIETAIVGDAIWYRVIVGPLNERGEINRAIRQLRDARIDTLQKQITD